MNTDYRPVSLEEYNQSLRDTVNSYYTHAMNSPEMSREDAIRTTGEMAEQYLQSVEEFQEAQNVTADIGTGATPANTVSAAENLEETCEDPTAGPEGPAVDDGLDL